MNLSEIIQELNERAKTHPVGDIQNFRKKIKGLQRVPTKLIFHSQPRDPEWTFHSGGREELQYNVGFEEVENTQTLRFGVAFSFETSQSLPDIDVLVPQVKYFNEFIQHNFEEFADMRMWYWREKPSSDYMPTIIPPELVTEGVFVFLGKRQPVERIDFEVILDSFDRLLPLYKYVVSNGNLSLISSTQANDSTFQPGRTVKKSSTTATITQHELDIVLRHNVMQQALSEKLANIYGEENVREEYQNVTGSKVDIALQREEVLWFYEIKTSPSPRYCIRQALGQLLEYAFWPTSPNVTKLIIVGESPLDDESDEYIKMLQTQFGLPVEYEQIII